MVTVDDIRKTILELKAEQLLKLKYIYWRLSYFTGLVDSRLLVELKEKMLNKEKIMDKERSDQLDEISQTVQLAWAEVIERFGDWRVTTKGLDHKRGLYNIGIDDLWESDWIEHVGRKQWANVHDFSAALEFAREFHINKKPKSD